MGPMQEAILIKFGNIIAGFVLWSYYGFLNLIKLFSPSLNSLPHPLLPSTTTVCGLRTIIRIIFRCSGLAFSYSLI